MQHEESEFDDLDERDDPLESDMDDDDEDESDFELHEKPTSPPKWWILVVALLVIAMLVWLILLAR